MNVQVQPHVTTTQRHLPFVVLETEFQTATGLAAVVDFMPSGDGAHLVRIVCVVLSK